MEFTILEAPTVAEIEQKVAEQQPISLKISAHPGAVRTLPPDNTVLLTDAVIIEKQHNRDISLTGHIGNIGNVNVRITHQFNPIGRIKA